MPADSERCSGTTALLAYSNYSEPHHLPGPGTQKSKCQKQMPWIPIKSKHLHSGQHSTASQSSSIQGTQDKQPSTKYAYSSRFCSPFPCLRVSPEPHLGHNVGKQTALMVHQLNFVGRRVIAPVPKGERTEAVDWTAIFQP